MQAILSKGTYGLDSVALAEQPMPTIQAHEVLVRIQAVSLNQLDLMVAEGAFATPLPHVLGSDASGIVEAIGDQVTTLAVGDEVVTHFIQSWQSGALTPTDLSRRLGTSVSGVFSEYVALPASSFVKVPRHLTTTEASTLPIAGLTAWEALTTVGSLQPGQTVLLQGTGGVSLFALLFAKAIGATVILLSGSDEKLAQAKALGADETINYRTSPHWQQRVEELTSGQGVDLALEMSWTDLSKTISCMKIGGRIAVIGLLGGANTDLSIFGILQKNLTLTGLQVGPKSSFEAMNQALERYAIHPVIDRVFPFADYAEALTYFQQGKHFGKVVIQF